MSDEVTTDQAPLPETPATDAAVSGTDPGDTTASASSTEQSETTETKEDRTFTQAELDEILGKRLARERQKMEREFRRSAAIPTATQIEQPAELSIDQFDTPEEYADALAERKAEQIAQRRVEEQEYRQVVEAHEAREDVIRDKYDDYDTVVRNDQLRVTPAMADVIRASEIGPEIAYYLGTNPKESARIAALSPLLQAKEIGRIERDLTVQPPVKKTTAAPTPINPTRVQGGKPHITDTTDPRSLDLPMEEWMRLENERVAKMRGMRTH